MLAPAGGVGANHYSYSSSQANLAPHASRLRFLLRLTRYNCPPPMVDKMCPSHMCPSHIEKVPRLWQDDHNTTVCLDGYRKLTTRVCLHARRKMTIDKAVFFFVFYIYKSCDLDGAGRCSLPTSATLFFSFSKSFVLFSNLRRPGIPTNYTPNGNLVNLSVIRPRMGNMTPMLPKRSCYCCRIKGVYKYLFVCFYSYENILAARSRSIN